MKKLLGLTLAVACILGTFGLLGCTQTQPLATVSNPLPEITGAEDTITVEINYADQKAAGVFPATYHEGLTAFDALTKVAADASFAVEASDSQYGKYIQAINGVKEDGTNFWLFSVNDEMAQQSADSTILNPGDSVTFNFGSM